ncbi:hypothetical protein M3Y94_00256900 [Aphelenchoides besseyi]|nr:hypothetical protein M3Y94_00256900 [Aphelenchoides besseyi]
MFFSRFACNRIWTFLLVVLFVCDFANSQCFDLGSNCKKLKRLCTEPAYTQFLRDHCPFSCNRCTRNGSSCRDQRRECSLWAANGFCTNPFFPKSQKKHLCALTCLLCN